MKASNMFLLKVLLTMSFCFGLIVLEKPVTAAQLDIDVFPSSAKSPTATTRPPYYNPPWPEPLDGQDPIGGAPGVFRAKYDNLYLASRGAYIIDGTDDFTVNAKQCNFPDYFRFYVANTVKSVRINCKKASIGKGVKIMLKPVILSNAPSQDTYKRVLVGFCQPFPILQAPPTPADIRRKFPGTEGNQGYDNMAGQSGINLSLKIDQLESIQSLWIDTSGCDGGAGGPGGRGGKGGRANCDTLGNSNYPGGNGGNGGVGGNGGNGGNTAKVELQILNGSIASPSVINPSCAKLSDIPIVTYNNGMFGPGGINAFPEGWPNQNGIFVWGARGEGGNGGIGGLGGEGGGKDTCTILNAHSNTALPGKPGESGLSGQDGLTGTCETVQVIKY